MAIKKTTLKAKKSIKKAAEVPDVADNVCDPIYNKFGTCISCQGGRFECLHTNLAEGPGGSYCVTCGEKF